MCLIYIYENERNKNRKEKKNREDEKSFDIFKLWKNLFKEKSISY